MTRYALDNAWERARHRLALLEEHLDPVSFRRLAALGVGEGWQCLEVAGGGGSVARWLCERVGASGHVTATDLDTRFLAEIGASNLTVQRHDITSDALPEGKFDLVHVRWLLHHLPQREAVLPRLAAALRPSGWLLIEDVDFFPLQASVPPPRERGHPARSVGRAKNSGQDARAPRQQSLYLEFMMALTESVVATSGGDRYWGRNLPALVAGLGLAEVGGEGDIPLLHGGAAIAKFFQLTGEQMREKVLATGAITKERFDAGLALLDDPKLWAFAGAGIAVWGRRK